MPLNIRTYLMSKADKLITRDDLRNLIHNENHLLFEDLINAGNMYRPGGKAERLCQKKKVSSQKTT